ncbi:MAG: hypothetical protein WDZ83_12080 [Rhizobiaceae bacterium]
MADERKRRDNLSETDLAQDKMGRNSLQGDDQSNVRNQRRSVPEVKKEADDVVESFRKLDKDVRARADLNKGSRGKGA